MIEKTVLRLVSSVRQRDKSVIVYGTLMSVAGVLGFIQLLVYAKILGSTALGYYTIVLTVASYAVSLQLGILSGLNRELPVLLGMGQAERARDLVGQATTALLMVAGGGLGVAALIVGNLSLADENVRWALFLGAAVAASNLFFQMGILRLRCERRTTTFASVFLLQKVITLVLGSVVAYYWSFGGLFAALIGTNVLLYWYVSRRHLDQAPWRMLKRYDLRSLIAVGFPILVTGALSSFRLNMDRVFLMGILPPDQLGLYQFGAIPLTMGLLLNGMINQYFTPRMLYHFGMHGDLRLVFKRAFVLSLVVLGLLLLLWPVFIVVAEWGVERWMPEYSDSLPLISLFYFGTVLLGGNVLSVTINAARRPVLDTVGTTVSVGVAVAGFSIAAILNLSVQWFAGVAVIGITVEYFVRLGVAWYCSVTGQGRIGPSAVSPVTLPDTLAGNLE